MISRIAGAALDRLRSLFHRNSGKPGSLSHGTVCPLDIPLQPDEKSGFRPYPVFSGLTGSDNFLSTHVSVLSPGKCPHPLHTHQEEEILLLLCGDLDLITSPEGETSDSGRRHLKPGHLLFYPAHFPHTIQSVGSVPANYLMVKWSAVSKTHESPLAFGHYELSEYGSDPKEIRGFHPRVLFEGPTSSLRKIQCHLSLLGPGAGYEPHADPYDVVIIVLEGEIETLGKHVQPHGVIFYASGEPHGIYNPGELPARYLVIEIHW